MEEYVLTRTPPFPHKSLQPFKGQKDDWVVYDKRTFFKVIFKFLRLCLQKYKKLHSGGCKLSLMPGLIIPWRTYTRAAYISFFSGGSPPCTWIIFKNNHTNIRVKKLLLKPPTRIIVSRLCPLFQTPSNIDIVWYLRDTNMTVAYTYQNNLYLLPDPIWVIDRTKARVWKTHHRNFIMTPSPIIREIKESHLHPHSPAWSINGQGVEQKLNYYMDKSLMWGAVIYRANICDI